jgi:hypothetical protein
MITRRSLFSLLPAPLAGFAGGLLTVVPEVSPAPASDPVAYAALLLREEMDAEVRTVGALERMYADPDRYAGRNRCLYTTPESERKTVAGQKDYHARLIADAEAMLRERLRPVRGLAVVVNGRVYQSDRSRNPQTVEPRWVSLLTPATA